MHVKKRTSCIALQLKKKQSNQNFSSILLIRIPDNVTFFWIILDSIRDATTFLKVLLLWDPGLISYTFSFRIISFNTYIKDRSSSINEKMNSDTSSTIRNTYGTTQTMLLILERQNSKYKNVTLFWRRLFCIYVYWRTTQRC